jgi:hypothetical protein
MDCPICFDTITSSTGSVTTSCGHTFHFKCLNTWYYKQIQNEDAKESCPCCRKEPGEYEIASVVTEEEEEEEEEEEVNEVEDEELLATRRWILTNNNTLQILARVANDLPKEERFPIPRYSEDAHAYWLLRNLFAEEEEPREVVAEPQEEAHLMDRAKMMRKRKRYFGREFWTRLGKEYELETLDGYITD